MTIHEVLLVLMIGYFQVLPILLQTSNMNVLFSSPVILNLFACDSK